MRVSLLNSRRMKVYITLKLHVIHKLISQICFYSLLTTSHFDFRTEQVLDGLDRAVLTMKKEEVAIITMAPEYAFGSTEFKQELAVVPPNSTVDFEVELVSFVKVSMKLFDEHIHTNIKLLCT